MATANAINADTAGIVTYNGTGTFSATSVTNHAILVGGASNAITSIPLTNGQLAIGSTGVDPVAATLTAGTGITIANSAGTITLNSAGGGLTTTAQTASFSAAVNNSYICSGSAATVVATLPATAALGDVVEIIGLFSSTHQWQLAVSGTGKISLGTLQGAATGSLTSTNVSDSVLVKCVTASPNPNWQAVYAVGNLTVA